MSGRPAVFTIAPESPFLDTLVAGIRARWGEAPEALADIRLLLPTRRACRAAAEAFLRAADGQALMLPRMTPLGDVDEDELAFDGGADLADVAVAPAIPALWRQLVLARRIREAGGPAPSPDQAARLAAELARLIDQVHTERLDFSRLDGLVPEDYAEHWQLTLDFLGRVAGGWPDDLARAGALDPADRRNRLLEAQARAWTERPPETPVIAAGSTGSLPATADLVAVVAGLPAGAVVLPGLDTEADDEAWDVLGPSHPQYGMARLLDRLDVARDDVRPWIETEAAAPSRARRRLAAAALRPPAAVGAPVSVAEARAALGGLATVVAPTPREEAGTIALALRETLETAGRTAVLVTPDRSLARRVAAELRRWGIEIDDSAGRPLTQCVPGVFLRLVAEAVAAELAPTPLLALLKHPLAAGGMAPAAFRGAARALERKALRGVRPAPGTAGLRAAVGEDADVGPLLAEIESALHPFAAVLSRRDLSLGEAVRAHVKAAETLARTDAEDGAARLWAGADGEAAADFVAEAAEAGDALGTIAGRDYAALFEALAAARVVRRPFGGHPRLAILGPLEARLQSADRVVLGGLNEGTWPAEAAASPWMSRPMMARFGLPLPERRVGLAAHDFTQALAAPEVVLTRAERVDGTPTVPSRWWVRIETALGAALGDDAPRPDPRWLDWLDALDRPEGPPAPVRRPAPTPPLAARPRRLSVTRVETWIRDAYTIYAREILGLKPEPPIDQAPDAAERGILVHKALERFVEQGRDALPEDAAERLIEIGRRAFEAHGARPGVQAFWWPRFVRASRWFADWERRRRAEGWSPLVVEADGRLALPGLDFELTGRADRIDRHADGRVAILDYKTGQVPSDRQIERGLAPQLPLEAAMLGHGGFADVGAATAAALVHVRFAGGRNAGEVRAYEDDVPGLAATTLDGLQRLVAAFDEPETPYLARERVQFEGREGDYDHLARLREWGVAGEDG